MLTASAAITAKTVVISRELCNGLWIVPLTWASEKGGKSHELTAVFDTGGLNLLIDPDGLERVSGQRLKNGQRERMESVSASGLNFSTLRPRVREMSHLGAALGLDFDVFLPFPAFDGKLLVLDYPAREMRIEEGALPEPDGKTVFSAAARDARPWLTVDLNGRKRRILIDSGSNGRLELKKLGRLGDALAEGATLVNYGAMSGEPCTLSQAVFGEIIGLVASGKLSAPIHATYPVKDIKEAVAVAAGGERNGKVIIVNDAETG